MPTLTLAITLSIIKIFERSSVKPKVTNFRRIDNCSACGAVYLSNWKPPEKIQELEKERLKVKEAMQKNEVLPEEKE